MNLGRLDEQFVRENLNNGECIMVINAKDFSSTWSRLRLIADSNDPIKPLI